MARNRTPRMPRGAFYTGLAGQILLLGGGFLTCVAAILLQSGRLGYLAGVFMIAGVVVCAVTWIAFDEMAGLAPVRTRAQKARLRHLREEVEAAEYQRQLEAENAKLRRARSE